MDCSVVPSKKHPDLCVVSTTDFFYPLVDDPFLQGKIACANVLSDMYAFGIDEVDNVLMLLASASNITNPNDRHIVTKLFIHGFDALCKEAGTTVTGGQTVVNPWPIIGGVAQSVCKMNEIIMPVNAVAGDVIVLTKPLGTQLAVNLKQWLQNETENKQWNDVKHVISKHNALRAYAMSCESMSRLNRTAARLMRKYGAHAATDVTGFGILGHASNLASNQKANVSFVIHTLPIFRGMRAVSELKKTFRLMEGYSAETSGGLFVCLPPASATAFCQELMSIDGQPAWIIGHVIPGDKSAVISSSVNVIEV